LAGLACTVKRDRIRGVICIYSKSSQFLDRFRQGLRPAETIRRVSGLV